MLKIKQQTIKESFSLKGKGLHTGKEVTITFQPAPVDYGYRFVRTDIDDSIEIPALADYVTELARSTILEKKEIKLQTIEHVLSALYGLEIDNCKILLDAQEPPILDGSAKFFVEAIEKVGIEKQEKDRDYFEVTEPIIVKQGNSEITLLPDTEFRLDVHISFENTPFLVNQYAQMYNTDEYKQEIAHCRTFVFFKELEMLLQSGIVKGGDLDNAIVIMDKKVPQEEIDRLAHLFGQKSKIIKEVGVISNEPLRYGNEPARHKLLDVIGDLALCGKFIKGRVIANRPGHAINTAMASEIRNRLTTPNIPVYRPEAKPVLDIHQIKKLLPHRYPFLLVDKILELSSTGIIGMKNVTFNEPFFIGHFPNEPIMPGVLIVEAMAQCGGIMVLHDIPDSHEYSTYFMKIEDFKFRKKVFPGDTLIFKLEIIRPVRRGIVYMEGAAYVDSKLVADGNLMAQIIKNKK